MSFLSMERMTDKFYQNSFKSLEKTARKRGVFVRFPKSAVNGLEPFSYVDFDGMDDQVSIRSFHAYPDQGTIIKMQSRIGVC